MNFRLKPLVFYAVLIVTGALLWAVLGSEPTSAPRTYSQFLQQVQSGQIASATIVPGHTGAARVSYSLKNGSRAHTFVPSDYGGVLEAMQHNMVDIEIRGASLTNAIPFFLLLGFWVVAMFMLQNRPGRGAGSGYRPGPG